jgi:hypothetical protein
MGEQRRMRMTAIMVMAGASVALMACEPRTATPVATQTAQVLSERAPFEGCSDWRTERQFGVSLAVQDCPEVKLVADPAQKAFFVEQGSDRTLALQVFEKPATAGPEAILAQVMTAGGAPAGATCALEPAPEGLTLAQGQSRFVLTPTGASKTAWEAALANTDLVPEAQPCGRLGVGVVGDRYFQIDAKNPAVVVFVELGSEAQIYDPATLRVD